MTPAAVECPIERNMPPQGRPWRRWGTGLTYFILFCIASTVCLLWALGYRVNWTAETLERTSILQLSTPQAGINAKVFINNVASPNGLPLTMRYLFPGYYDVSVQADGYQTWEKTVHIGENELVSYPGILLLYTVPQAVTPPDIRIDQIENRTYNNNGIEIRSENELWVSGQFITRTSANILNPEYYFDTKHVIYQAGTELIERDLVAGTSETLVTLTTNAPVPYVTQDNGRTLVYVEDSALKAVALYQQASIIDRLGVSR